MTEDMIRTALISKAAAPQGWQALGSVQTYEGGDSLRECEEHTSTSCGGFVAVGWNTLSLAGAERLTDRLSGSASCRSGLWMMRRQA
ncbi:hypothetical protein ACFV30_39695 [Streptomyces sp. NPDC059752]|uniref:hypothetical protein n=1 Tax=unclassified Streptomyces TaxID=2593676 RepID=UPI00364F7350